MGCRRGPRNPKAGPLYSAMFLAVLAISGCRKEVPREADRGASGPPSGTILREERFGAYRLVIRARGEFAGCRDAEAFEILRDGRPVFSSLDAETDACYFRPGETDGSEDSAETDAGVWPPMGADITGDGRPDLVVRGYLRGFVDSSLFIFEIGETFRPILVLDRVCACIPVFKDHDGDGFPEIHAEDAVYEDVARALEATEDPRPVVILKYRGDGHEPAPELMRGAWLGLETFDQKLEGHRARLARNDHDGDDAAGLVGSVLNAVYSGQAPAGWRLFDLAWPDSDPKKAEVRGLLSDALRRSPYRDALMEVNAPEPVLPPEGI